MMFLRIQLCLIFVFFLEAQIVSGKLREQLKKAKIVHEKLKYVQSWPKYQNEGKRVENFPPNFHELFAHPRGINKVLKQMHTYKLIRDVIREIARDPRNMKKPRQILSDKAYVILLQARLQHTLCKSQLKSSDCNKNEPYRSLDGSCNNLLHPNWGLAGQVYKRNVPPAYQDGVELPRTLDKKGKKLPNARRISNEIHKEGKKTKMGEILSVMVMQWGQFIAYDVAATPTIRGVNGSSLDCCGKDRHRDECFSINIPTNDPHFTGTCMNMVRSAPGVGSGCFVSKRQQINTVTSYIDASNVYGSSENDAMNLRYKHNGLLKTAVMNWLPRGDSKSCISEKSYDYCTKAGGDRSNVVPSLGALHTLFVREHNRIARKLKCHNPLWSDQKLYQESRKIVIALIQHITYTEYLSVILGKEGMHSHLLAINSLGHDYTVYDENINAGVANSFSTAAFRFGHSQIPKIQGVLPKLDSKVKELDVEKTFHKPYFIQSGEQSLQEMFRWLINDAKPLSDGELVPAVRDSLFLFNNVSFDLAALNIQRGRDHGLPSYNAWRKWCSLPVARNFLELIDHAPEVIRKLESVYNHPNDIDIFTGGLSESHESGMEVGPTFACIIGTQFRELRKGDRFWYENPDPLTGFTYNQIKSLKRMTLSKIVCENLNLEMIQRLVMFLPSNYHPRRKCSEFPDLDFSAWQEKLGPIEKC